jgi:hypothetical protein
MGCFSTNGFYPTTSSCSSNTSSPDSLKHQRLLVTATPSPPNVSHQYFQQQQYLFDHHRFRFNHNNNNNNNNSNSNGSSEIHSSSSSTTSSHDQLPLWLAAQSSGQQPQQQSRFSNDLLHF